MTRKETPDLVRVRDALGLLLPGFGPHLAARCFRYGEGEIDGERLLRAVERPLHDLPRDPVLVAEVRHGLPDANQVGAKKPRALGELYEVHAPSVRTYVFGVK